MTKQEPAIPIMGLSSEKGGRIVLNNIKRWCVQPESKCIEKQTVKVSIIQSIEEARIKLQNISNNNIFVFVGFDETIFNTLGNIVENKKIFTDFIIRPIRLFPPLPAEKRKVPYEINNYPSSSMLCNEKSNIRYVVVQETIIAIRKSIIRLKAINNGLMLRQLQTLEDYNQYFSFRYRIGKEQSYIPDYWDCPNSQWELNFTDKHALPLGLFQDNKLVAAGRLVFLKELEEQKSVIDTVLKQKQDEKLHDAYQQKRSFQLPFDVLESFPNFHQKYKRLGLKKIKAEISRIYVDPDYRKKGYGEIIVDSLIEMAQKRGVEYLFLATEEKNKDFYQKSFFTPLRDIRCERFANVNVPAIAMIREM